jgi:hypothetical protein
MSEVCLPAASGGPYAQHNGGDDQYRAQELEARGVIGLPGHHATGAEREKKNGDNVAHRVSFRRPDLPPTLSVSGSTY